MGSRPLQLSLAVQLGAFVLVLGIPDGALGVLWPSIRATFKLPLDGLGILTIAGAVLYIAGGLTANRICARTGPGAATVGACALACVAFLSWGLAPNWLVVLAAVALLGLAKGIIDAVLNAEAALAGGVRRLGLLHGSWAIGGTLGPLIVATVLAADHDWRPVLALAMCAVFVVTLIAAVELLRREVPRGTRPPQATAPSNPEKLTLDTTAREDGRARRSGGLGTWRLAFVLAAFVAYTAADSGPIAWGYTYLIFDRHLSRTFAAVAVALFWAALTAGRFGLALVNERLPGAAILEVSCGCLVVGTALLWLLPAALAVIGLPICGLGAAAIFPMLVALTPARIGEAGTRHAIGVSIAAAGLGAPVAITLFGLLAAHLGMGVLGPCFFLAAVLTYVVNRTLTMVTRGAPA
jgi:fucose permease